MNNVEIHYSSYKYLLGIAGSSSVDMYAGTASEQVSLSSHIGKYEISMDDETWAMATADYGTPIWSVNSNRIVVSAAADGRAATLSVAALPEAQETLSCTLTCQFGEMRSSMDVTVSFHSIPEVLDLADSYRLEYGSPIIIAPTLAGQACTSAETDNEFMTAEEADSGNIKGLLLTAIKYTKSTPLSVTFSVDNLTLTRTVDVSINIPSPYTDEFGNQFFADLQDEKELIIRSAYRGENVTSIEYPDYICGLPVKKIAGPLAKNGTADPERLDVVLPNTITSVYFGNSAMTSIVIPNSVTQMGQNAFSGCAGLESVTLGNGITRLEDRTFAQCTSLTTITLPSTLSFIGKNVFNNCQSLTSISIPDSVTTVGDSAFSGCTSLMYITIQDGDNDVSLGNEVFMNCSAVESITMPDSIKQMGSRVFLQCTNLKYVTFGGGISAIPEGTFSYCTDLSQISIPSTITAIGKNAFAGCSNLSQVFFASTLSAIGTSAFANTHLASQQLPLNISSIGESAFPSSTKLQCEYDSNTARTLSDAGYSFYNPGDTSFALRIIDDKVILVKYTGTGTEVETPWCISGIFNAATEQDGAFYNSGITKVTIGYGVTSIGNYAFASCSQLKSVVLAQGVTSIGENAFSNCRVLSEVTLPDNLSMQLSDLPFTKAVTYITSTNSDTGNMLHDANIIFMDKDGNIHSNVHVDAVPATCLEYGKAEGYKCNVEKCNYTSGFEQVEPIGHEYDDPIYEWNDDYTYVTGILVCKRDDSHRETEMVVATSSVKTKASCEVPGTTAYTSASFTNPVFSKQVKEVQDIPALGHDWNTAVYVWSSDNSTVTASRLCWRNASHVQRESVGTTWKLTKSPTETVKGSRTYTSKPFLNEDFSVQTKLVYNVPALSGLKKLSLPSVLKTIESEAFTGGAFECVIIPSGVTTIGDRAFKDCPNLIYVYVPSTVTSISANAFDDSVIVDKGTK